MDQNIYLIVQFNWPRPLKKEHGAKAKNLHQVLTEHDWIEEVLAASGGIGKGPSSVWVLKLAGYAALDRLLKQDNPVSTAYADFFNEMIDIEDMIREEVTFT